MHPHRKLISMLLITMGRSVDCSMRTTPRLHRHRGSWHNRPQRLFTCQPTRSLQTRFFHRRNPRNMLNRIIHHQSHHRSLLDHLLIFPMLIYHGTTGSTPVLVLALALVLVSFHLEHVAGFEPARPGWKPDMLTTDITHARIIPKKLHHSSHQSNQ